jgi:hypothetical protein
MGKKKTILVFIFGLLVGAFLGYFGGLEYEAHKLSQRDANKYGSMQK